MYKKLTAVLIAVTILVSSVPIMAVGTDASDETAPSPLPSLEKRVADATASDG
jgi:hypothetical protein